MHIQWIKAQLLCCRLQAMQIKWGWARFCMILLRHELYTLPLEVIGNEHEVRMDRGLLNLPHATQCLVMEASSQPPEDKQSPRIKDGTIWSVSLPTVTSVVVLQSTGLLLDCRRTSSPGTDIRTMVLPMLTWSLMPTMFVFFQRICFSCSYTRYPEMMTRFSVCRYSQGYHVQNSWRRLPEPWRTSGDPGISLGECQLPHWTQVATNAHPASGIPIYSLYKQHQPLTMSSLWRSHHITRLDTWLNAFFPDQQKPWIVSSWRHGTFLVTGGQRIRPHRCCIQAWSLTACHQYAFVVIGSSQPPF